MPGRTLLLLAALAAIACDAGTSGTPVGAPPATFDTRAPSPVTSPTAGLEDPTPVPEPTPTIDATPGVASGGRPEMPRPRVRDTATPVAVKCTTGREFNRFAATLLDAMTRRDARALEATMGRSFTFVVEATDVAIPDMTAPTAVKTLLTGLRADGFLGPGGKPAIIPLAKAAAVRCAPGVPLDRATGQAVLGRPYEAAFLVTGWGTPGDEEAFVFLAKTSSGRIVWRGAWYSTTGFER